MERESYSSDLTDLEWELIEPLIPPAKTGGHPRTVDIREILNGLFYVMRTGCAWSMIPHDLPPYSTVYSYFRKWQKRQVWAKINLVLRRSLRELDGKDPLPTGAIADSQSVKTTEKRGPCMDMMVEKR